MTGDLKTELKNVSRPSNVKEKEKPSFTQESKCRILVGNIPTDVIGQNHLDEIFNPYGEIVGISVHKGFAFVQFTKESAAAEAIESERNRIIAGRRLQVCFAEEADTDKTASPPPERKMLPHRPPVPPPGLPPGFPPGIPSRIPFGMPPPPHGMPPIGMPHLPVPPFARPRAMPSERAAPVPELKMGAKVIVAERHPRLIGYAEMIHSRLSRLGLTCSIGFLDKLFTNEMAVDLATRDGMLYAACVNIENEIHSSVTLYILHGQAQEHRNMPLQHSITLVATNFDEYIRKLKEKVAPAEEKEESTGIMEDVEPATSLILLNLAEGKAANLKQLEVVLNHILKLRDKLTGSDDSKRFHKILERLNAEDNGEIDPPEKVAQKQADDLQAKINQLFGNSKKQLITVGASNSSSTSPNIPMLSNSRKPLPADGSSKKAGIDFSNPTVQNALKSLIKTSPNILNTIKVKSPERLLHQNAPTHDNSSSGRSTSKSREKEGQHIPTIGQSYHNKSSANKDVPPSPEKERSRRSEEYYYKRDEYKREDYKRDDHKRDIYKRDDHKRSDMKRDDYKRDDYKRDDRRDDRRYSDRESSKEYRDRDRSRSRSPKHKRAKPGRPAIAGFF